MVGEDMKTKPLILMTQKISTEWLGNKLAQTEVIFGDEESRGIDQTLLPYLDRAEGIFCLLDDPLPKDIIDQAEHLKVISTMAVGVDNIDISACTSRGIAVGHTPGVLTDGTADLTLALILAVSRQIPQASNDAKNGLWSSWDPQGWLGVDLKNATIGIIGMGKIGSAVAKRLSAFGAKLIFCNTSPRQVLAKELDAIQVDLDELLKTSDIICLHVPLTRETKHMINTESFKKMKPTAILINAARGAVVDQSALFQALQGGQIKAAGLDVTDPEPLPPDHPLYQLDNCLITPHIGSATFNTRRTMADIAIKNILAGLEGRKLVHCVNPEVYS
jgi:lactate dehydrogenase-like 2-hydroxyacid dehydrogenase